MSRRLLLLAVSALVFAGVAAQAQAATFTVGTTNDVTGACPNPAGGLCSLRQVIAYENGLAATPNPPDVVLLPGGTYNLSHGVLTLNRSVVIVGAGARATKIQQTSSPVDRVFDIPNAGPTIAISGLTISGGTANSSNGYFGGDIHNRATLSLSEDWITKGTATAGSGGGISNDSGNLTVSHSLISANQSTCCGGDSGGIQNFGSTGPPDRPGHLVVDNSTITGNTAALGGGIMSWGDNNNTTVITNSTVAYNDGGTRSTTGGGLLASQGTITVANSIVAFNTVDNPSTGSASNCSASPPNGTISSAGYNLENQSDCGFASTGDLQFTNPIFTSTTPQNNGGNTDTLGIAPTSLAVDHIPAGLANCGATDQRDVTRPQAAGCDTGAVEFSAPPEGQQFSGVVAIPGCSLSSSPSPSISWGDGTSSLAGVNQAGALTGAHTYAEEGTYHGTVQWSDDCGSHRQAMTFAVPDAPLSVTGDSISTTPGTPFSGEVAKFTDSDPAGTASDYTATINWGDGSVSAGVVVAIPGRFAVNGTHTYVSPGNYNPTVSVADAGGAKAAGQAPAAVAASPPTVQPTATATPGITGATITGVVNPRGLATTASFQYGLDSRYLAAADGPSYTQSTGDQQVGADSSNHTVSASVSGLVPNAVYHYRLVATSRAGTVYGPDQTFTTRTGAPPPPPTLGRTNVTPVGLVLIVLNGQLVPLTEATQLPSGTVLDTLHGAVNLVAASGKKGHRFTGTFGGAVFKVSQARSGANKALTTLNLLEGGFPGAPTYASCKAKTARALAHAALSRRVLQSLRSSGSGRFRTRGRYASGTVRGTRWTTTDRCDGTLISVQLHSVFVQDLVKHITKLITQGHHYLAKAH